MFKKCLFMLLLCFPLFVCAESGSINYSNLNKEYDLHVGCLDIETLKFVDNSKGHIFNFGLVGEIENESDDVIILKSSVKYYTDKKVLILSDTKEFELKPNEVLNFMQMNSAHIVNSKYEVEDIGLYSVEFETVEGALEKENIIPSSSGKYNEEKFIIDSYDISINVNSNRTMDIEETFEVFSNGSYELERQIPLAVELYKNSGMIYKSSSTVSKVKTNKDYRKVFKDDNLILKFLKRDEITGTKIYELEYSYDHGRDLYKKSDELYFEVINNTYDVPIGNTYFKITFPEEIDTSNFDLSLRSKNEYTGELRYKVVGNTVEGYLDGILENEEAIFLSANFENGYFKRNFTRDFLMDYSVFIIPGIMLIVAFILWLLFGKDRKTKEVFTSMLPKSLSNIDSALIYKGEVNSRDVIFLLIDLANKGYIEISNVGKNGNVSLKNISIKKLKEYDGKNEIEKLVLDALFYKKLFYISESMLKTNYKKGRAGRRLVKKEIVLERKEIISGLEESLPIILERTNSSENYEKIYEKRATIVSKFTQFLAFLIAISGIAIPVYYYAGEGYAIGAALLVILGGISIELMMSKRLNETLKRIALCIFILIVIMFLYLPIVESLVYKVVYEAGVIFGFIAIIGVIEFVNIMPKRTEYGTDKLGKIDGFKRFIESSNEDTILETYKENPDYFYEILIHANSIQLSEKWYSKFDKMITKYPKWFKTKKSFELKSFYKDLSNLVVYLDRKTNVKRDSTKK